MEARWIRCLSSLGMICSGGLITLADGQIVEYDWLVLALGAETTTFGIPGVRELALPFSTFDDANKVHLPPCRHPKV